MTNATRIAYLNSRAGTPDLPEAIMAAFSSAQITLSADGNRVEEVGVAARRELPTPDIGQEIDRAR
jgi:hypothetical protein